MKAKYPLEVGGQYYNASETEWQGVMNSFPLTTVREQWVKVKQSRYRPGVAQRVPGS
jgi:hypothetical protein